MWYKQVIFQNALSKRLLENRLLYQEVDSLKPLIKAQLNHLNSAELSVEKEDFLEIRINGALRWKVSRSAIQAGKVAVTFYYQESNKRGIQQIIGGITP